MFPLLILLMFPHSESVWRRTSCELTDLWRKWLEAGASVVAVKDSGIEEVEASMGRPARRDVIEAAAKQAHGRRRRHLRTVPLCLFLLLSMCPLH